MVLPTTPVVKVGASLLKTIKDNFKTFTYRASSNPEPTIGLNPIADDKIAAAIDLFNAGKSQEYVRKAIGIPNNHARVIYRTLKRTDDKLYQIIGSPGKQTTQLTPEQIQYFLRNTATVKRPGSSHRQIAEELGVKRDQIDDLNTILYNNPERLELLNEAIRKGEIPNVVDELDVTKYTGPQKARLLAGKNPATKSQTNTAKRRRAEKRYLQDPKVLQADKDLFKQAYAIMTTSNAVFKDVPGFTKNVDHIRALRFFQNINEGVLISPWVVFILPNRALEFELCFKTSKKLVNIFW